MLLTFQTERAELLPKKYKKFKCIFLFLMATVLLFKKNKGTKYYFTKLAILMILIYYVISDSMLIRIYIINV